MRALIIIAAVILAVHGLLHLLGTAVYMQWATVEGLPYKTALWGGRLEIGEGGMRIFGTLWSLAAIGFLSAAAGLLVDGEWWRPVLVGVTLTSLVLTTLDWESAYAGIAVNLLILTALWIGPGLKNL